MIKDLRPALRAFLLADTNVAAIVGVRVFPSVMPQGVTASSLVYQRISAFGDHHMQGASGYAVARWQIAAWSERLDDAEALANRVKYRLDGYRGTMGTGLAAVKVQGAFFESENPPTHDTARKLYGVGRDYMIHFAER